MPFWTNGVVRKFRMETTIRNILNTILTRALYFISKSPNSRKKNEQNLKYVFI